MAYDPNRHRRRSIRLRGYDYTQAGCYFVTICTHERRCLFGAIDGGVLRPNDAGRMIERWWGELNRKFPGIQTDAFVVMPDHIHGIIMITAANGIIADRVDPDGIDGGNAGRVDSIVGINAGGVDSIVGINAGGVDSIVGINAGGYADPPLRADADDSNPSNAINANPSVGADWHIRPRRANNDPTDVDADLHIRPPRAANHPTDADVDNAANDTNDPRVRASASLSTIIQWFKIMTTNEYIRRVKQDGWSPFSRRIWQRNYYEHIIRDDRELDATRRYIAENPIRWIEGADNLDALLARMDGRD
jgi:REP element-mobilizing transposase RayT